MNKLKTGIIGLRYDDGILDALRQNDRFEITAIYDADKADVLARASDLDCQGYDDHRRLIISEPLDVIFLLLPDYLCQECIAEAAKRKIHILKSSPVGRDLNESALAVKLMRDNNAQYHICNYKRFAPGYRFAHKILSTKVLGRIYLIRAEKFYNYPDSFDFRSDPVLAGGGVLINEGIKLIDIITWNFGQVAQVYGHHTNYCARRSLPPYLTEDTAAIIMDFDDGAIANLQCSWMTGTASEKIWFHGSEGSIEAGENFVKHYDAQGQIIEQEIFEVSQQQLIKNQIQHFADSLCDPELPSLSLAHNQLINIAVVEAAYLSAKTRMPESLKRFEMLC